MTALNKQALREAAEKATPGRVGDRIDGSGSIKYECHGYDGSLVLRADHKNMEYGFIGDNGDADEFFFRLCVPDVILALLDELEEKDDALKSSGKRESAARRRIDELLAENDAAESRIAELEARTVTLQDVEKWRYVDAVRAQSAYKVLVSKVLAAAGIGVKGGAE